VVEQIIPGFDAAGSKSDSSFAQLIMDQSQIERGVFDHQNSQFSFHVSRVFV